MCDIKTLLPLSFNLWWKVKTNCIKRAKESLTGSTQILNCPTMHAIVIRKGKARRFPYVTANLCLQGAWLKTDMDLIALPSWGNTANVVALLFFSVLFFYSIHIPALLFYFSLSLTHFFKPTLAEATVWAVNPLPERQLNSIIRRANNLTELIVHYIPSQMADGERIMFGIALKTGIEHMLNMTRSCS